MTDPTTPESAVPAPERKPYTMTPAALEQRRAAAKLSTGPTSEEGKAASSRNAWKHGRYSELIQRHYDAGLSSLAAHFGKPCRTTCPIHPDNPERKQAPCSIVLDGRTQAGESCLDKSVYVDAFDAILAAINDRETAGVDAMVANEIAASKQMLHDMRRVIAETGGVVIIPAINDEGEVIYDRDDNIVAAKILPHPLIPHVFRALEVLGFNLGELAVTPKAREARKTGKETADAMQVMLGGLMQRLGSASRGRVLEHGEEPDA